MNNDLISRTDTIKFIKSGFPMTTSIKVILCYLETVKSAESVEIIGEWIKHEDYNDSIKYGCSRCGNLTNIPSNFCPNCGQAKKKGGIK